MAPLDYRQCQLKAKGRAVGWASQTGLLIEHAVGAKCGISAITPNDLPSTLDWSLDGLRGNRAVVAYNDDRALAVRCAKQVRKDEHAAGFGQISAVVRACGGNILSDHDQLLEVVLGPPIGRVSAELRARVVHNDKHRASIRGWLQKEANGEWWRALAASGAGLGGRLVVLIELNPDQHEALRNPVVTRADFLPNLAGAEWRPLWGWPGSRCLHDIVARFLRPKCISAATTDRAPSAARPAAPVQEPLRLREPVRHKPTWETVENFLVNNDHFQTLRGVEVAPLAVFLRFIKRASAAKHIGRDVVAWKTTFNWSASMVFQGKRGGSKRGGTPQWVGTRAVLKKLLEIY
jgi:hypothetical protein